MIPNATLPIDSFNGQDPYRTSHVDIEEWVNMGFPREGTETYRDTILASLSSKNLAMDIRFPESDKIMGTLDKKIFAYLQRVENNEIDEADKAAERLAVANQISIEWTSIIESYDSKKPISEPAILEQYQRSLGIFQPPYDYNYIGNVRWFGWTLGIIVIVSSIIFAAWVLWQRKTRIVKASQPFFLILICVGCLTIGAGIFPLGIDDEIATQRGCNIACMSRIWLLGLGFSCSFSALFSKTRRVNKVFRAAKSFTRIKVTVKDVIKPLIILLTTNIVILSIWNAVDPLV